MARRPSSQDPRPAQTVPQEAEREMSLAEDRWLDLIADIIVEDLLKKDEQ
jgi:hypothetical protein